MCPINRRRPFVEMYEVVQNELVREAASGEEPKYKGFINQTYTNELPSLLPERYIRKDAFVTLAAEYSTGTVTVGTATTNIVGVSTVWTSAHDDFNIKVSGYDMIYRISYEAGTSVTFQNSLTWTASSGSGLSYSMFQNRYSLASDFGYMAADNPDDPNNVYTHNAGNRIYCTPLETEEYFRRYGESVQDMPAVYTVDINSAGSPYLYVWPNPEDAKIMGYSYIPELVSMRELSTGTATVAGASGTSLVLTTNASMIASLNTADTLYFRNDADGTGSESQWVQISTVTNATVATLSSARSVLITSGAGVTYTISEISKWPARFEDAMIYRAAYIADPDGLQQPKWLNAFNSSIMLDKSIESKKKRGHRLKYFPGARR